MNPLVYLLFFEALFCSNTMKKVLVIILLAFTTQGYCATNMLQRPIEFGKNILRQLPIPRVRFFDDKVTTTERTTLQPVAQVVNAANTTIAPVLSPELRPITPENNPQPVSCLTSFQSDDEIRQKLCQNSSSRAYRFDPDVKICSQVGTQSHCGKNMVFYASNENMVFGHCDCNYSSKTPLIYHKDTNRCYFIYQQAFCGYDEWLELRREDGKAVCMKNKCYNSGRIKFGAPPLAELDVEPEFVPLGRDGPCVRLNQPNSKNCKRKGDIVTFIQPLKFYAECGQPIKNLPPAGELPSVRFLGDVPTLQCSPGTFMADVGNCQPEWEFD